MNFTHNERNVLLLEDNATTAERLSHAGVGNADASVTITVRVHRITGSKRTVAVSTMYKAGSLRSGPEGRIELALRLLDQIGVSGAAVVVAGASYGATAAFRELLTERGFPFVVQIRPGTIVIPMKNRPASVEAATLLDRARWKELTVLMPNGLKVNCSATTLDDVVVVDKRAKLFVVRFDGIKDIHGGVIWGLSSVNASLSKVVSLISHARWVRGAIRRGAKQTHEADAKVGTAEVAAHLTARTNIALARRHDARVSLVSQTFDAPVAGPFGRAASVLNVVELFSGAGGLGLGFLLGGGADTRYRIVYSGEANPVVVETLRRNHGAFARMRGKPAGALTPEVIQPVDLRQKEAINNAAAAANEMGGTHLVIGGPPCQGFSMANRNSHWSGNPNNELVDVFVNYIRRLKPLIFLMENVQGILWTSSGATSVSVVDVIEKRLRAAGYFVFPKLLDTVWYGVPQHRTRFYLMGLHRDLGYERDNFGEWGPFPVPTHGTTALPWVTVREAIADLPEIGNGTSEDTLCYPELSLEELRRNQFLRYVRDGAEQGVVFDHVTSRHSDYVIDRYQRIPPGGNWESIRNDLTNYADVKRTHSNIYRRLVWDDPAITIGHYRKSMLVHPAQTRGLSLREASRLQSFPDWFRFAGSANGGSGGLAQKQQQLANAVCPLLAKTLAEFMLRL